MRSISSLGTSKGTSRSTIAKFITGRHRSFIANSDLSSIKSVTQRHITMTSKRRSSSFKTFLTHYNFSSITT